ncbi:MAG: ABC transporter permease [Gemmatimonadaceae bacterium]|nr:ABC transporter permease [Gemmatimonadaceae bacterium]
MLGLPEWLSPTAVVAKLRALYRGLRQRESLESEMEAEFAHHIAARTADLEAEGLSPAEAAARARSEFGHANTHRADAREAMGLSSIAEIRFSWLDLKMAVRLLRKYPMLNLAAVFALAVGIPVGVAPSHVARALSAPLPGDTDNRIRAVRLWDPLSSSVAPSWEEQFEHWSTSLRSFSTMAAFQATVVNVGPVDGRATPFAGARVSPIVFQMLGARTMHGRLFDSGDFAPDAPDVVVIGDDVWASQFGRDPGILGRSIRVGAAVHQVVGVMPAGFAFPSSQSLWLPLRGAGAGDLRSRLQIIGRLAEGVTAERAQLELDALGPAPQRVAEDLDETRTRERLRAEVVPFGLLYLGLPAGGLKALPEYRFVQLIMVTLLLVACGNVAMLVFARTATRLRELAIRTALGASRVRIVSQVFVETLVLAVAGAGVGLLAVQWTLSHVNLAAIAGENALPYWLSLDLTRTTVLSALAFAVVSATLAGVLPAITITGRAIAAHIGGVARLRFGKLIGGLIVADIAVSIAAVGMAFAVSGHALDLRGADLASGVPASEYLAVELRLPPEGARTQRAFIAALAAEPGVRAVTSGDALPRMEHASRPFELDARDADADGRRRWTRVARVDVDYFTALESPVLRGRGFATMDADGSSRVAIVNTAFVDRELGGGDALGRRVRFPLRAGLGDADWYDIIGVVGHLGVNVLSPDHGAAVYLPADVGTTNPLQVAIHAAVPPLGLVPRVREIAASTDPDLIVGRVAVLSDLRQGDWYLVMGVALGLVLLAAVLVALATSGLYAMLSLAVTERTREIGIRAALGATRRSLLLTILRRPLTQMGIGALIGLPLAARFVFELNASDGNGSVLRSLALALGLAGTLVALVAVVSCLTPMRRILAIEASEAMRADG